MALFGNLVGLIALVCAIWVIYDVWTQNKKATTGMKVVWTIAALIFSILTAIVYYLMGRK